MVIVRITMNVLPEKQLELTQTLLSMIEPVGGEVGCRSCAVYSDLEDKNYFSLLEEWETREDLEHHLKSSRFGILLGSKILLSEPLRIQIDSVSRSEGMEAVYAARNKNIQSLPL